MTKYVGKVYSVLQTAGGKVNEGRNKDSGNILYEAKSAFDCFTSA